MFTHRFHQLRHFTASETGLVGYRLDGKVTRHEYGSPPGCLASPGLVCAAATRTGARGVPQDQQSGSATASYYAGAKHLPLLALSTLGSSCNTTRPNVVSIMEPLSAVASVIALTQAIEKLLKAAKLAKSVGQIPREYLELVEELELNRALAQEVTEHIRYQNGGDWQMLRDISSRLNGGVKSLEQITDMVVKKPSRSSQNGRNEGVTVISTFRWQMNKHEIAKTREQFRQIKGSLQLCLQLLMSTQSWVTATRRGPKIS